MKLITATNYSDMSRIATEIILKRIKSSDKLTLGLATGSTPIETYQYMIEDYQQNKTDYHHVTTFNLDEYVGVGPTDRTSYYYFMKSKLFDHIHIPREQTHIPNGLANNLEDECSYYENKIKNQGGIDLQLLGLGSNGHIGFNEPGTNFDIKTHVEQLTEATRSANARFFDSLEEVPTHAITMGISTILQSNEILLLVSGEKKSSALTKLLKDTKLDPSFPASSLHNHPNVTIVADQEALQYANLT
ncbi:glucosamine-6-phosphate deaminase [Paraliobacillus sediminis]|uniref:glucosamine-6-phosphate deaminase n=1 Tax=Paraliobacillus sediminis TaxID=1885916 RepID=UPI000E3B73E5|nr:glucosamine-6-phosphate deaminase [Paraliobacillus sediminis]